MKGELFFISCYSVILANFSCRRLQKVSRFIFRVKNNQQKAEVNKRNFVQNKKKLKHPPFFQSTII